MLYLSDPDVTLYHGDALTTLCELPNESVHCIATSPPFYALRDYGVDGQIGLEDTPDEWAARLVEVFAEARRVLRQDGTLWIECGDSYCANTQGSPKPSASTKGHVHGWVPNSWGGGQATPLRHPTKPKDLLGQPFLLAFALRSDGWYWRGVYPWHKPNAMPESAKDRCTTAHSYVLHFSRSARYFFDGDAISEPFSANTHARGRSIGVKQEEEQEGGTGRAGRNNASFGYAILRNLDAVPPQIETLDGSDGEAPRGADGRRVTHVEKGPNSIQHRNGERWPNEQRHPRSVWTIPTEPYKDAHFATWPTELARRIILAGCPEGGTVLDPFGGSGTTGFVARKHGRKAVLIELNADYCEMASRRLAQQSLLAEGVA